jgi:putative phosphoribosyl transferase
MPFTDRRHAGRRLARMLNHLRGEDVVAEIARQARSEILRRAARYRDGGPRQSLAGRTAVVVDDGIAIGATARVACRVVKAQGAARVVLAVPVCSSDTAADLRGEVDELVCLATPVRLLGVGAFYADFRQTMDEEVVDLLRRAASPAPG